MRFRALPRSMCCAVVLAGMLSVCSAADEQEPAQATLQNGDRVVLLGGTFIERSQAYGEIELALKLRYSDRSLSFRNLGWAGDTVWAESRGIFDSPGKGYQQMLTQLKELKPTVVMLHYGSNEALADVDHGTFQKQFESLVASIEQLSARVVVLSPLRQFTVPGPKPDPTVGNRKLSAMNDFLRTWSQQKNVPYVELFNWEPPASEVFTTNGIHLNAIGYRSIAAHIMRQFDGGIPTAKLTKEPNQASEQKRINMTWSRLPLPGERIMISDDIADVSSKSWGVEFPSQNGTTTVPVSKGGELFADEPLTRDMRAAIVEKNFLYFQQWRPQNITYLFLFRKHEQGNNAKEIPQFTPLVQSQEAEIERLRQSRPTRHLIQLAAPSGE